MTNDLPDRQLLIFGFVPPQLDSLTVLSNSPQAAIIANAIQTVRATQPGGFFHDVGDIFNVPQLAEQSPFLNWNDSIQQQGGISDVAYEMIPGQLLSLLRADSVGSLAWTNGQWLVQFTGYDGHAYVVQTSPDLVDWTNLGTNSPVDGAFGFPVSPAPGAGPQFYRSRLVQ